MDHAGDPAQQHANTTADGSEVAKELESITLFEPPTELVCEFGDVILVVNNDYHPIVKVKVSSCMLATSSPVFKALFSKNFAEGHAIRKAHHTPAHIHVVDPERPFLKLCRLLHLQEIAALT